MIRSIPKMFMNASCFRSCAPIEFLCHSPALPFPAENGRISRPCCGTLRHKISAGVSTGIGSHVEEVSEKGDEQFEIADNRNLDEVCAAIRQSRTATCNERLYFRVRIEIMEQKSLVKVAVTNRRLLRKLPRGADRSLGQ